MQIRYLNGSRFKLALLAGARRLGERASFLNRINVFPVPDGDTGTNMAGTVRAMAFALSSSPALSLGAAARTAADSALTGARGNSGAILAQFFQGMAEELEREARLTTRAFAEAVNRAVQRTYQALSRPREGTLLTILKDWGSALHRVSRKTDDFIVLLRATLKEARASVERTRQMLPELRKAGVVDAGALGWVHLLEGVLQYISHGRLRDYLSQPTGAEAAEAAPEDGGPPRDTGEPSAFRYCTECMLEGEDLDRDSLRRALEPLGDSIVAAGSRRRVRIHIHTDVPAQAFRVLEGHARVCMQKVDDMEMQRALSVDPPACAVLVDSTCDLPEPERRALRIERVPLTVTVDGKDYLDRDGLSPDDFQERMRIPGAALSTSQPSDTAFRRKLEVLLGSSGEAVYLGVSGNLSGTLEAGRRAVASLKAPERVRVLDSLHISVGYALLARKAAQAAEAGASAEEIVRLVESLRPRLCFLVAVPDLSGLIRSGRVGGVKGLAARIFGLRPIITVDGQGRAASLGLYFGARNGAAALFRRLLKAAAKRPGGPDEGPLEVLIGHARAQGEAEALAGRIASRFTRVREPEIVEVSPALALHAGPGALALAALLPESGAP